MDRQILNQKVRQRISVTKTYTLYFLRIGILDHVLSEENKNHHGLFSLLRFFDKPFDGIIDDPFLTL